MDRHVKGLLFKEYVIMIRKLKHVDWGKYLTPSEMEVLNQVILSMKWYPLETYQRFGAAVFQEIAKGDPEVARSWGRASMDGLAKIFKNGLIKDNAPLKSLENFSRLSGRFFDFDGFDIKAHGENHVEIKLDRGFGSSFSNAYSHQMLGAFERLFELSGAIDLKAGFSKKIWEGAQNTIIDFSWNGIGS